MKSPWLFEYRGDNSHRIVSHTEINHIFRLNKIDPNSVKFVCTNTAEKSVIFGFDLDTPTDKDLTKIGERLAKDLEKYLNE